MSSASDGVSSTVPSSVVGLVLASIFVIMVSCAAVYNGRKYSQPPRVGPLIARSGTALPKTPLEVDTTTVPSNSTTASAVATPPQLRARHKAKNSLSISTEVANTYREKDPEPAVDATSDATPVKAAPPKALSSPSSLTSLQKSSAPRTKPPLQLQIQQALLSQLSGSSGVDPDTLSLAANAAAQVLSNTTKSCPPSPNFPNTLSLPPQNRFLSPRGSTSQNTSQAPSPHGSSPVIGSSSSSGYGTHLNGGYPNGAPSGAYANGAYAGHTSHGPYANHGTHAPLANPASHPSPNSTGPNGSPNGGYTLMSPGMNGSSSGNSLAGANASGNPPGTPATNGNVLASAHAQAVSFINQYQQQYGTMPPFPTSYAPVRPGFPGSPAFPGAYVSGTPAASPAMSPGAYSYSYSGTPGRRAASGPAVSPPTLKSRRSSTFLNMTALDRPTDHTERLVKELEIARWRLTVQQEELRQAETEHRDALVALAQRAQRAESKLKELEGSTPSSSSSSSPLSTISVPARERTHPMAYADLEQITSFTPATPLKPVGSSSSLNSMGSYGFTRAPSQASLGYSATSQGYPYTPYGSYIGDDEDLLVIVNSQTPKKKRRRRRKKTGTQTPGGHTPGTHTPSNLSHDEEASTVTATPEAIRVEVRADAHAEVHTDARSVSMRPPTRPSTSDGIPRSSLAPDASSSSSEDEDTNASASAGVTVVVTDTTDRSPKAGLGIDSSYMGSFPTYLSHD